MKSPYCTFFIARHGITEWNKRGIIQGHTDIDLDAEGVFQAQELAKLFRGVSFSRIISSDLLRAKNTAKVIADEKQLTLETTPQLRERYWGQWEGKRFSDLKMKLGEAFNLVIHHLNDIEQSSIVELKDVESIPQAMARTVPFLKGIAEKHPGESILILTHGGILKSLLYYFKFTSSIAIPNTSYLVVHADGDSLIFQKAHGIVL